MINRQRLLLVDQILTLLPELVGLLRPKYWVDPERSERVTVEQIHVLNQLDPKRAITVKGLAAVLKVSEAAASQSTSRLAARGYVDKRKDPEDGRRKLVTVTPAGMKARRLGLQPEEGMVRRALTRVECGEGNLAARGLRHLWRAAVMGRGQPDPWPERPPGDRRRYCRD